MIGFKQKIIIAASITVATVAIILIGIFFYRHLHKNNIPIDPPPSPPPKFQINSPGFDEVDLDSN